MTWLHYEAHMYSVIMAGSTKFRSLVYQNKMLLDFPIQNHLTPSWDVANPKGITNIETLISCIQLFLPYIIKFSSVAHDKYIEAFPV